MGVVLGVLLLGLTILMVSLFWNQTRQFRATGNRLPPYATVLIFVAIAVGIAFGIWLSNNR